MTEKRKQELRRLLDEAIPNVVIEVHEGYESISVEKYKEYAKAFQKSYRPDLSFILEYSPNIQDDSVKSKLFNFLKEELVDYIREDESICPPYTYWIQPAKTAMRGPKTNIRGTRVLLPLPLDRLLEKFLKIVTVSGSEQAISELDRCTRDTIGTFQKIIFLKGLLIHYPDITRKAHETHVAEGIRLVQLSSSSEDLPPYVFHERLIPHLFHERSIPNLFHESFIPVVDNTRFSIFSHAALLMIDYTVSPLFSKPFVKAVDESDQFEIKIKSAEFPNFDVDKFCQASSLIANYPVESLLQWQYIGENELFNAGGWLPQTMDNLAMPDYGSGIGIINETDINKAKHLYKLLTNPSSNIGEKLEIPIDRWIKSKTSQSFEDSIIDLGIAFESLYLADRDGNSELSFQLRLRASWFLGRDKKAHREDLMKDFTKIYDWRSKVVHTGKLPNKTKRTPFTRQEIAEFIEKSQDLCRQSILKVLKNGEFPDWNNLILG